MSSDELKDELVKDELVETTLENINKINKILMILNQDVVHNAQQLLADNFENHQYIGSSVPFADDGEFHLYGIEWDENKIIWYFDGEETFKIIRSNPNIASTWPFDSEFHLILNTAIGGNLGGTVNTTALSSSKYMEVDYVKMYQKP